MNRSHFIHLARLESDYKAMQKLRGERISWVATGEYNLSQGIYPSQYSITYQVLAPTVKGNRRKHELSVNTSAADYPDNAQPFVRFTTPVLKHPHMFSDGRVCLGGFPLEDSLADMCIRIFRFFIFDMGVINPKSIATRSFWDWFQVNKQQLPLERVSLPTLSDGLVVKHRDRVRSGFTVKGRRD